ncbi:MAG: hypothetical protein Terrestrivirus5_132 [Terrestrivirus sp.]|uniref:Uncharacterized protein n=1 Tax=Terrestrivirus sp. TaxID=2487775 RepID=A0A3G4ZN51_9VIRU|nr:MAG: hypothetical protein Terrestrivirus5_132 [Terrestrivirus sp.]
MEHINHDIIKYFIHSFIACILCSLHLSNKYICSYLTIIITMLTIWIFPQLLSTRTINLIAITNINFTTLVGSIKYINAAIFSIIQYSGNTNKHLEIYAMYFTLCATFGLIIDKIINYYWKDINDEINTYLSRQISKKCKQFEEIKTNEIIEKLTDEFNDGILTINTNRFISQKLQAKIKSYIEAESKLNDFDKDDSDKDISDTKQIDEDLKNALNSLYTNVLVEIDDVNKRKIIIEKMVNNTMNQLIEIRNENKIK